MNATKETTTAAVAETGASVAPKKVAKTARRATAKKKAATPRKGAKKAAKKLDAAIPKEFSKASIVVELLRQKGGATMTELTKKTGWQRHSVRGFLSGTVGKKMGLKVERSTNDAKESVYRIAK